MSPLSQGADRRLQKEWLEERRTTDLLCHDGSIIQEIFASLLSPFPAFCNINVALMLQ